MSFNDCVVLLLSQIYIGFWLNKFRQSMVLLTCWFVLGSFITGHHCLGWAFYTQIVLFVVVIGLLLVHHAAHDEMYGVVSSRKLSSGTTDGTDLKAVAATGPPTAHTTVAPAPSFSVRLAKKLNRRVGTPSYKGKYADDSVLFGGLNEYMGWTVGQLLLVFVFVAWCLIVFVERLDFYLTGIDQIPENFECPDDLPEGQQCATRGSMRTLAFAKALAHINIRCWWLAEASGHRWDGVFVERKFCDGSSWRNEVVSAKMKVCGGSGVWGNGSRGWVARTRSVRCVLSRGLNAIGCAQRARASASPDPLWQSGNTQ